MKMENNIDSGYGSNYLIISMIGTVFAWTLKDIQTALTIIATLVSITTGVLGGIYYLKKIKNEK